MGDISVHNSAGANDNPNTVTSVNANVGRVVDLFMTKEEAAIIQSQVNANTENVTEVVENAPVSLNTFKELSDNLQVSDFLAALGDD
ncbi:MAG TPA: hypothetical protein DCS80_08150 [Betaproteobacteria bacterium]|nr:hypothetical protein [Betaproteobacteria bacterium]